MLPSVLPHQKDRMRKETYRHRHSASELTINLKTGKMTENLHYVRGKTVWSVKVCIRRE